MDRTKEAGLLISFKMIYKRMFYDKNYRSCDSLNMSSIFKILFFLENLETLFLEKIARLFSIIFSQLVLPAYQISWKSMILSYEDKVSLI